MGVVVDQQSQMLRSFTRSIGQVAAMLLFSSALILAQTPRSAGQSKATDDSGGPAPVHHLNGTWKGAIEPSLNNRVPVMTPVAMERLKLNIPDPFSESSNDPWKTCDPLGMPRIVNNEIGEIGFAGMPDRIVILENFAKVWREVWMDGRPLPKDVGHKGGPSTMYFGYSVGHWDGDNTLVVDTIGMDDKTWVDRRGYPHSIDARVIERYTRVDHNHLNFTETMDDPAYYAQPFVVAKASYKWIEAQDNPNVPIPFSSEYLCIRRRRSNI
jgi:hypothetical protein